MRPGPSPRTGDGSDTESDDDFDALLREMAKMPAFPRHVSPARGDLLARGRFELADMLGEGAMGVVFEAFDRERGTRVALKTIASPDPEYLLRLKNEFRALADVAHPNLVRLHELFAEGGRWFFTMERIVGENFARWVRPSDRFDEGRVRAGLEQLLRGLGAIHAAGKLHGDLKPSNVLVRRDGRVQLLDFGLSADWQSPARQPPGLLSGLSGTPAYMAPEQASGRARDIASDYYALGVMVFQALTGALPFSGPADALLSSKRARPAPDPGQFAANLPADLERLCVQLLARDPAARRDAITRWLGASRPLRDRQPGTPAAALAAPIGRDTELTTLLQAYDAVRAGTPVVQCVTGESGIGKTTLCEAFLDTLPDADAVQIVRGRCRERESIPYKAIDPWVDALSRYLSGVPEDAARALLPADSAALATLFPVLARVRAVAAPSLEAARDPRELQRRAFVAFVALLRAIARERPLVLYVDDLQWTDRDSAALLTHLFADATPPPVLVLIAMRSAGDPPAEHAAAILAAARQSRAFALRTLALGPLSSDATRALARRVLPATSAAGTLADIEREAAGHPLFALELAYMASAGGPTRASAATLGALLHARVGALPDSARRLLELLALAGQPLPRGLVLAAAAAGHDDLDALIALRLLRSAALDAGQPIECYHDKIREHACAAIEADAARDGFARLSRALVAAGDADPALLGRCMLGAGDREGAAVQIRRAAEQAAAALAFDRAAELYECALELGAPAPSDRVTLTVQRARALANAGRGAEAARAFRTAGDLSTGDQRLQWLLHSAYQLLDSGYPDPGMRLLVKLCRTLRVHFPVEPYAALAWLPWTAVRSWLHARLGRGTRRELPADTRTALRLQTTHTIAIVMGAHTPLHAASATERYLALARTRGDRGHQVRALGLTAALWSGVTPYASRIDHLVGRMTQLAYDAADPALFGISSLYQANVAFNRGAFVATRKHGARALAALRNCTEVIGELEAARVFAQLSAHACGDYADVIHTTPELLDDAQRRGRRWMVAMLSGYAGAPVWLGPDEPAAYRLQLDEARRQWSARSAPGWVEYLLALGEASLHLYRGEAERAAALLASHRAAFRRSTMILLGPFRWQYSALMLQCNAAALRTRPDRSGVRRVQRALPRLHHTQPAAAAIAAASLALTRGDSDTARVELHRALGHSEALGTQMVSAAIRRRLGQLHGGDTGTDLIHGADAFMRAHGTASVDAMTELNCPGCRPL